MLVFLVTRELTFKTSEGRKEGPDGPPDPCPLSSHFILPSPVKLILGTGSEGRWQISAQEFCTNSLGFSVFEWRGWHGAGKVMIHAHPGG